METEEDSGEQISKPSSETRVWLLTGEPAIGKSSAFSKIILQVKSAGYTVGGVLTREVRSRGERTGFQITDVSSEQSEVLAGVSGIIGPKIGKYKVSLSSLASIGVKALEYAKEHSDLVVCDEVGPMELLSPEFRRAIRSAVIENDKPALCVVHKRYQDPLIEELRKLKESREEEITFENRDFLPGEISREIITALSRR